MAQSHHTTPHPVHPQFHDQLSRHQPLPQTHPLIMDPEHPQKVQQVGRHQPFELHDAHDKLVVSECVDRDWVWV